MERSKRKIVDLENVKTTKIVEKKISKIGKIFHFPFICFKKYIERKKDKSKNPARIFG